MAPFKILSKEVGWFALAIILLSSFALMLFASQGDSLIMDELAHIPAGYGYVKYFDFRLNPEHPPLLKALAGLPLAFQDLRFPLESSAWQKDINGQWLAGTQFIFESGNDADQLISWARLGPILLTLLTAFLIFFWASEMFGYLWAIVPTILFAFSPNVLAHGHYVTTDVAAMFGILLATFAFVKFLKQPSRKNLLWAGLAFGVAQACKFSAVLLIPYFLFLIVAFYLVRVIRNWSETKREDRLKRFGVQAWRYGRAVVLIFIIGYVFVIYPMYLTFTLNYPVERQAADTTQILASFANGPTPAGQICKPARCLADLNVWMSKNEVTRPFAEYMLGVLMVMQRSAGGNTAYFLGEVSNGGSRLYFPTAYLLKEPLPILIFTFLALFLALAWIGKKVSEKRSKRELLLNYFENNFTQFAWLTFIIFYWAYSIKSPLNIGFRHLFPTLPLIYLLATSAWRKWMQFTVKIDSDSPIEIFRAWITSGLKIFGRYVVLVGLIFWLMTEAVLAAPYFLSYFNELGGGTSEGYRYITDSNYDWGQDMKRLYEFVQTYNACVTTQCENTFGWNIPQGDRRPIGKIAIDYFGGAKAQYYFGDQAENWWSSRGNPKDSGIEWLALSINTIQGAVQPTAKDFFRKPEDEYNWLVALRGKEPGMGGAPKPDYRIGTSIFLYKL